MKINRLEAHDRFTYVQKQDFDIGRACQEIIEEEPFGRRQFYIFAHKREISPDERVSLFNSGAFKSFEEVPTHRLLWQSRLTRPTPQENSMLFKAFPPTDNLKIIWMIPEREMWAQFEKGKMTENRIVWESIDAFKNAFDKLAAPDPEDPTDEEVQQIYIGLARSPKIVPFNPLLR